MKIKNLKIKSNEIKKAIKEIVKEKIGLWKYPRSIEFVKTRKMTKAEKQMRLLAKEELATKEV